MTDTGVQIITAGCVSVVLALLKIFSMRNARACANESQPKRAAAKQAKPRHRTRKQ